MALEIIMGNPLAIAITGLAAVLLTDFRDTGYSDPVVIIARLATPGPPCPISNLNEAGGPTYGSPYRAAPCQRVTENPLHPSCWQTDEDPCFILSDAGFFTTNGACPSDPCKVEYVVDITFVEPCTVAPCDQPKCCASQTMRITDLGQSLGFLFNGETKTFNSIKSCDCSELKDNDCIVAMQAQCQQLGYYYYQLAEWGYPFRCGKCN